MLTSYFRVCKSWVLLSKTGTGKGKKLKGVNLYSASRVQRL